MAAQLQYPTTSVGRQLSPVPPQSRRLIFIVELGMKIPYAPTAPSYSDQQWIQFMEPVRTSLQQAGLNDCVVKMKCHNDHRTWCITNNYDDRYWFDIVSPKFLYEDRDSWLQPLLKVFSAVRRARISPSDFWGTRVHVAASPTLLQREINALAKMVMQHNNGFNSLAWDLWSNGVHVNARSMLWVPAFDGTTRRYIHYIESALRPEDIARVMNMDGGGQRQIRPWNFWPLVPPGLSFTNFVEYNLGSGSRTVGDAIMWINLVCLFVRGSLACNGTWARGTFKTGERVLFVESDLSKFVLEQAQEVGLPENERSRLRERLAYPGKKVEERK
ncbi:hypothetical protein F5Y10DRAFT_266339 [Nemania abortiva]|nr:hypothetical protein F5Y10DRAFT_266339 [Nemania abortiva]